MSKVITRAERDRMLADANYKVDEAGFFLIHLRSRERSTDLNSSTEFHYYFSAFLSAARSALQLLFDGPTWNWVSAELANCTPGERETYKAFTDLRDANVHRDVAAGKATEMIEMVPERSVAQTTGPRRGISLHAEASRYSVANGRRQDARGKGRKHDMASGGVRRQVSEARSPNSRAAITSDVVAVRPFDSLRSQFDRIPLARARNKSCNPDQETLLCRAGSRCLCTCSCHGRSTLPQPRFQPRSPSQSIGRTRAPKDCDDRRVPTRNGRSPQGHLVVQIHP